MIEVLHLSKSYGGRRAVDDASFRVEQGEIVGFLGPNGAGKSTTLRILTGYLAPTDGEVRVGGVDVLADPLGARTGFGYMPEGVPLYPEMRVDEYLAFRASLKRVPRRAVRAAVDRAVDWADVKDARTRIIGQLSKGYRQRVGLADALVADPPLLILDEPTAGLDPNQIRHVRALVRGFAGKKTVLLSTHILPEVEATCSRVLIIHEGKLVGEGTPGKLRAGDGTQVVVVEVRDTRASDSAGAAARARARLASVPGVREVLEATEVAGESAGVVRLRLRTDASDGSIAAAIAERISEAALADGLLLRELRVEAATLEQVFAQLTTKEAAAEAPGASSAPAASTGATP